MTYQPGLDRWLRERCPEAAGMRVGLLTHAAAVTSQLRPGWRALHDAVRLVALFSPEHGFASTAADGVHVASTVEPSTGLPIHSLYGATQRPTPDMLAGIDLLVIDLQDIGVRYYTYVWTATHALDAAGAAGIPVLVLDRINPLGRMLGGPMLEPAFASLVGRCPVPVQHGLSIGELLWLYNTRWNPTPAALTVIPYQDRRQRAEGWPSSVPFVPTSPAMAHLDAVRNYPGACLVEGTNLSEGRGTALPFEIVGAPFIDADRLADAADRFEGMVVRSHTFTPTAGKWAGQVCGGVQVHLPRRADAFMIWSILLGTIVRLYPQHVTFTPEHFDRLAGNERVRAAIASGGSERVDRAALADFDALRQEYFIYA